MKKTMAVVGVVLGLMAGCVNAASVMVYFNRLLRQSLAFLVLGASLAQTATAAGIAAARLRFLHAGLVEAAAAVCSGALAPVDGPAAAAATERRDGLPPQVCG
jgi:hypothetical protein